MLFFNEFADKWQCELSTKCCPNSKPIFGIHIHPESELRASIPRLIRSATVTPTTNWLHDFLFILFDCDNEAAIDIK